MGFNLPKVDPSTIPNSWLKTAVPLSRGEPVKVYRGFSDNARNHSLHIIRDQDIRQGGIISRDPAAAHDAIFNQYGRDPELIDKNLLAGVVEITIESLLWNELVSTFNIVERYYPGFCRRLSSSEIRVNTTRAGELIDQCTKRILSPDNKYDYRFSP